VKNGAECDLPLLGESHRLSADYEVSWQANSLPSRPTEHVVGPLFVDPPLGEAMVSEDRTFQHVCIMDDGGNHLPVLIRAAQFQCLTI
jgi:hypothetical protein